MNGMVRKKWKIELLEKKDIVKKVIGFAYLGKGREERLSFVLCRFWMKDVRY